jgi:hypothetical protein
MPATETTNTTIGSGISTTWQLVNKLLGNFFRVVFCLSDKIEGGQGDLDPAALFD